VQAEVVVKFNPYLSNVFIYKKFHRLQRLFLRKIFIAQLKKQHYDLCIMLESNEEYASFAKKICPDALRIGVESEFSENNLHKTIGFSRECHAIENYLKIASKLDIQLDKDCCNMDFFLPEPDERLKLLIKEHSKNGFFIIHPSCSRGLPYRGWEIDKLAKIAKGIAEKGLDVFITGAATDKEPGLLLSIVNNEQSVFSFLGKSLYEVAYLIKNSRGILCYDTGILHVAQALKAPFVGLFGPSDVKHTGPIGGGKFEVVKKDFSCGPCQYNPQYHSKEKEFCMSGEVTKCMSAITAEEAMAAVNRVIDSYEKRSNA
jgi:ADP-heptose:LPS heptosyltransferase